MAVSGKRQRGKFALGLAVCGLFVFWSPALSAQDGSTVSELDAFWKKVSSSVANWSLEAQRATYHPDAIAVSGDAKTYRTSLLRLFYDSLAAVPSSNTSPNLNVEFRFSSRVHDAHTAHEVGVYRVWSVGRADFFGAVDSYLVKKNGEWVILVEIQREQGLPRSAWDALRP